MRIALPLPLMLRDMTHTDIEAMPWSGGLSHLENMRRQLTRARAGQAGYLVACPPSDIPVGKCGIDYETDDTGAVIWQVAVHPALRSVGIGTALITHAEQRIRERGRTTARLSVETNNPRARALYERLGYVALYDTADSWMTDEGLYETVLTVMLKRLG